MKFLLLLLLIVFFSCEKQTTAEKEKIVTDQELKEESSITAEKKMAIFEKDFNRHRLHTPEEKLRSNFPNFDTAAIQQILKAIPKDVIITSAEMESFTGIITIDYVTKDNTSTGLKYFELNHDNEWVNSNPSISEAPPKRKYIKRSENRVLEK